MVGGGRGGLSRRARAASRLRPTQRRPGALNSGGIVPRHRRGAPMSLWLPSLPESLAPSQISRSVRECASVAFKASPIVKVSTQGFFVWRSSCSPSRARGPSSASLPPGARCISYWSLVFGRGPTCVFCWSLHSRSLYSLLLPLSSFIPINCCYVSVRVCPLN